MLTQEFFRMVNGSKFWHPLGIHPEEPSEIPCIKLTLLSKTVPVNFIQHIIKLPSTGDSLSWSLSVVFVCKCVKPVSLCLHLSPNKPTTVKLEIKLTYHIA